jgi:hypothetical protein
LLFALMAVCAFSAALGTLGMASYDYALTRGLTRLQDAQLLADYAYQPQMINADIVLWQTLGWGCLLMGSLIVYALLTLKRDEWATRQA